MSPTTPSALGCEHSTVVLAPSATIRLPVHSITMQQSFRNRFSRRPNHNESFRGPSSISPPGAHLAPPRLLGGLRRVHDRKMDGWWRSCGSRLVQTYRGDVPPMGRVEGMDLVGFFSQTSDDPCGHAGVDLLGTTIFACKRPRREVASAGGAYPDASGCAITAGIAAHTYTWDVGWRRARLCAPEAQFTQGLPLTTTNPSQAGLLARKGSPIPQVRDRRYSAFHDPAGNRPQPRVQDTRMETTGRSLLRSRWTGRRRRSRGPHAGSSLACRLQK